MTGAITLVLRSTDEARNAWRRGALRYSCSILRRFGEHRAADLLLKRASELATKVPEPEGAFDGL